LDHDRGPDGKLREIIDQQIGAHLPFPGQRQVGAAPEMPGPDARSGEAQGFDAASRQREGHLRRLGVDRLAPVPRQV
jgi:hypothetical protein